MPRAHPDDSCLAPVFRLDHSTKSLGNIAKANEIVNIFHSHLNVTFCLDHVYRSNLHFVFVKIVHKSTTTLFSVKKKEPHFAWFTAKNFSKTTPKLNLLDMHNFRQAVCNGDDTETVELDRLTRHRARAKVGGCGNRMESSLALIPG